MTDDTGSAPAPGRPEIAGHGSAKHLRHEAITMALYVATCLLAALAALTNAALTRGVVFELIWTTTIGLAIAHLFAFLVAARFLDRGQITSATRATSLAQLLGALVVAVLVTIAVLLVPTSEELDAARLDIAIILGLLGYVIARNVPQTRGRSALFAFAVALFGFAVAAAKHWVTH